MLPLHEAAVRRALSQYRDDPVAYAADVLGAAITPQQAEIARRLTESPRRVLVPSANKVGKTFAAGWLVNWHHDAYDPGIVLATSTTGRQVRTQLFKEVRKLRPLGMGLPPRAAEITHTQTHFVQGFATNSADAFQGSHESAFLLVMDEATGVPAEFWDRAGTMFTGEPGHFWICFYNPNDPTTPAYTAEQSDGWTVVRLSALDHPNVEAELRGEPPPFPAAVRLRTLEQRIEKECEFCGGTPERDAFHWPPIDSVSRLPKGAGAMPWGWYVPKTALFEVQVLGRWPSKAQESVWAEGDWEKCLKPQAVDPKWAVQIGCDTSRFGGDRTTFAVRKGTALVHLEAVQRWRTNRPSKETADRLRELAKRYAPPGVDPRAVPCLVDDTGGYGSGVTDHPDGFSFFGVNASEAADRPDRYPNRRSELWWVLRKAADEDCFSAGPCREGRELLTELGAELKVARYVLDRKNRRVVESKDSMKPRLKRSPDLADAVALAWYPVPG